MTAIEGRFADARQAFGQPCPFKRSTFKERAVTYFGDPVWKDGVFYAVIPRKRFRVDGLYRSTVDARGNIQYTRVVVIPLIAGQYDRSVRLVVIPLLVRNPAPAFFHAIMIHKLSRICRKKHDLLKNTRPSVDFIFADISLLAKC